MTSGETMKSEDLLKILESIPGEWEVIGSGYYNQVWELREGESENIGNTHGVFLYNDYLMPLAWIKIDFQKESVELEYIGEDLCATAYELEKQTDEDSRRNFDNVLAQIRKLAVE